MNNVPVVVVGDIHDVTMLMCFPPPLILTEGASLDPVIEDAG